MYVLSMVKFPHVMMQSLTYEGIRMTSEEHSSHTFKGQPNLAIKDHLYSKQTIGHFQRGYMLYIVDVCKVSAS